MKKELSVPRNLTRLNPDKARYFNTSNVQITNHFCSVIITTHLLHRYHLPNGWERDVNGNTVPVMFSAENIPCNIRELQIINELSANDETDSEDDITEYSDDDVESSSGEEDIE